LGGNFLRLATILAACALAACQTAPAPPPEPATAPFFTVVDLTDDFVAFYDRTEGMESAARVAAFRTEFNNLFPGFYDPSRLRNMTSERYDQGLARVFERFPQTRESFLATTSSFGASIAPARDSFLAAFPDARPVGNIYFLHSLGEMDGGTRDINGQSYSIFGADVMARIYRPGEERAFFHHEIFHFYHRQYFTGCEPFWCALWREGLATYVAEQLNPGANDQALLFNLPRPIRPEVDANLSLAVCTALARLESEDENEYAQYFFGNASVEGLPPRAGYYLGYLIAKETGRTRTLQELAHLSPSEARPLVATTLASLAECPASAAN
jgi:hypothetical protein